MVLLLYNNCVFLSIKNFVSFSSNDFQHLFKETSSNCISLKPAFFSTLKLIGTSSKFIFSPSSTAKTSTLFKILFSANCDLLFKSLSKHNKLVFDTIQVFGTSI